VRLIVRPVVKIANTAARADIRDVNSLNRRAAWLLVALWSGATAHANEDSIKLELITPPRSTGFSRVIYPLEDTYRTREGWVTLNFMVDPEGKPYAIAVTESSGEQSFVAATLKAAEKWKFEPAMIDGEPIHAGHHYTSYFIHHYVRGVRTQFAAAYGRAIAAITAGDRVRAEAELGQLTVENLYEDVFSNLAKHQFAAKWGSEAEQIRSLRRAVMQVSRPRYLPPKQLVTALETLLSLELRTRDYASALTTWERLQRRVRDKESLAKWQKAIDAAKAVRDDGSAYEVPGQIAADSSSWYYHLYKRRFQVVVASGRVSEIKLRCERDYISFGYDPELYYQVTEKAGQCYMELVGDPGTQFQLIQA
jgi:TonB family protein